MLLVQIKLNSPIAHAFYLGREGSKFSSLNYDETVAHTYSASVPTEKR